MAIVLEGMDNSGKSTLAERFGLDILHPGPRPRTWDEEVRCMEEQLKTARLPVVMDRITCVSSQVYKGKLFDKEYTKYLNLMINTHNCVFIYCRPPQKVVLDMRRHNPKSYDTPQHLADIEKNAKLYLDSYDKVFARVPHLMYNYYAPDESVIQTALDLVFNIGAWKKWIAWTK